MKNGSFVRAVLAIVLASSLNVVRIAAQGNAARITGVVVSKQSGQVVAGAQVSVAGGSQKAATAGGGRFVLDNLPPGPVVLVVKAPGFLELRTADLSARTGETTQITIELEPTPNYLE